MAAEDRLRTYRGKRDFERPRELSGQERRAVGASPVRGADPRREPDALRLPARRFAAVGPVFPAALSGQRATRILKELTWRTS